MSIAPAISVTPSGAALGADVEGVDFSKPIDDRTTQELRDLLARYRILIFRDQALEPDDQVRAMRVFGNVLDESQRGAFYTYVSADDGSLVKPGRLLFHSDNHFLPEPLEALSLYGEKVLGSAAPTLFVDNIAAYKRLPEALKAQVADARVTNASYYFWGQGGDKTARSVEPDIKEAPHTTHPLIWHHPATGEPFLYLTELHARQIEGLTAEASEALLRELYEVLYAPEHIYVHKWQSGDLIVWDNRASQHARGPVPLDIDPAAPSRRLRRVVAGTKDFHEQFTIPEAIKAAH